MPGPRVFISAGEPSGDQHAATLALALRDRIPGATIEAFGGPRLAQAGVQVEYRMERYTAIGLAEIATRVPAHIALYRTLKRRFAAGHFDLLVCVDYPGFNLRLAGVAKRAGASVLYYIAPKLWATRPGRADRLRRSVDRLAVIFPFEVGFFENLGIRTEFVGHPLMDRRSWPARHAARSALGIGNGERVLALFPGSRPSEIQRLWPPFRDAAARLMSEGRCGRTLLAALPGRSYDGLGRIDAVERDSLSVLAAADAVIAKSGTTTLEAAVAGVPMVAAYRVHWLTAFLARRLIRVPWVTPVNLVAGARVVEELRQGNVSSAAVADRASRLLDPSDPGTVAQRSALEAVRKRLGGPGAASRVAEIAAELVG